MSDNESTDSNPNTDPDNEDGRILNGDNPNEGEEGVKRKHPKADDVEGEDGPSFKRQRFEAQSEEAHFLWELPQEMQKYVSKHIEEFIPEKDLKDSILQHSPLPSNLRKPRKLDEYVKELLLEKRRKREIADDEMMTRLQHRTLNVFGPMCKLWFCIEDALEKGKDSPDNKVEVDVSELSNYMDQTVLLMGQAVNAITYNRRLNVLSAITDKSKAKMSIKDNADLLQDAEEKDLFGQAFRKNMKETAKAMKESKEVYKQSFSRRDSVNKRPFQRGPPFSRHNGGRAAATTTSFKGFTRRDDSGGFKGNRPGFNNKKPFHFGKTQQRNSSFFQHCHTGSTEIKKPKYCTITRTSECTSTDKEIFLKESGNKSVSTCRKAAILSRKLESLNQRPANSRMGFRSEDRLYRRTFPGQKAQPSKNVKARVFTSGAGNKVHVGKRSYSDNLSKKGQFSKQHLFSPKERWGEQASHQSEEPKFLCPILPFQNGGHAFAEGHAGAERLPMQNRFKGCIFLCSASQILSEICLFPMGRPDIRISLPLLWVRPSSSNFHEVNENSDISVEEIKRSDNHLSGRYATDVQDKKRNGNSQRFFDFSITSSRVHSESREIYFEASPENRVLRDGSKLSGYDGFSSQTEGNRSCTEMQGFNKTSRAKIMGPDKLNRVVMLHSSGSATSHVASEISSERSNFGDKGKMFLPVSGASQSGFYSRTRMVDEQFRNFEWESNYSDGNQNPDPDRCIQEGLGSILPERVYKRSVDTAGSSASYKCVRTEGNSPSLANLHQNDAITKCSFPNRQHVGPVLPIENGRHTEHGDDSHIERDLGIFHQKRDHDYSRAPARTFERQGRSCIKTFSGLKRVAIISKCFSNDLSEDGVTRDRSVCITSVSPTPRVCSMEARSSEPSNRCSSNKVEKPGLSLCFSPILPNRKGANKTEGGQEYNDPNYPKLAHTSMVCSSVKSLCSQASTATIATKSIAESTGTASSSGCKQNPETGGMESLRQRLRSEGISERASELIRCARRKGTSANYESSWKKWISWCSEWEVDPFRCHVNFILDFLAQLFESGYEYSTINCHRSAISAYHDKFDGIPAGQHRKVCELMTGIFNKKPPQPRYTFIWDVEQVIRYISSLQQNSELTDRTLLLKLSTLLFLTSSGRCHEICFLDIRYMTRTGDFIRFYFSKVTKSWKKGKVPPSIEFRTYALDKKLCVVACLEEYLKRSEQWRQQKQNQLLLSHLRPHREVKSSTVAGWVKLLLKFAGIDTSKFKAHSCRSAASSKAVSMGISLEGVLRRGQWSGESTWQKHYHKPIVSEEFESAILKNV